MPNLVRRRGSGHPNRRGGRGRGRGRGQPPPPPPAAPKGKSLPRKESQFDEDDLYDDYDYDDYEDDEYPSMNSGTEDVEKVKPRRKKVFEILKQDLNSKSY